MDETRVATEHGRQALVELALRLAQDTPLAPGPYERRLLQDFVQGHRTLAQVMELLDAEATPCR